MQANEFNDDTLQWDQIVLGTGEAYVGSGIYNGSTPYVYCQPPCTFVFPPWSLSTSTTLSMPLQTVTVQDVWPYVSTAGNGAVTTVYVTQTVTTTISIPPIVTNQIPVWALPFPDTSRTVYNLESSIIFPAVTLSQPSKTITTNGVTATLPGVTWTYRYVKLTRLLKQQNLTIAHL
jgi:chitinase